jgi:hypothetical protein
MSDQSPTTWLRENWPESDDEAAAAAHALMRQRRDEEALQALQALTPFERRLAEGAYHAGVSAMRDALDALIGPAATTLDAEQVRRVLPRHEPRFR